MKTHPPRFFDVVGKRRLIALLSFILASTAAAAPLPTAYGVWDRGEAQDPREFPFLRGTSCDAPWDVIEKNPGAYDWTVMDDAIEQAYRNKVSLYFSFEAGPRTPGWVYEKGVPKVVTDNERHADKFPHYPYYLSPVYKTYYHRFLTAVAQHIRGYPKDRQERIAFIQVKTGCTGDETPYKGRALKPEYELVKNSAAWRAFRLETFALYAKLFDQGPEPKISLLFGSINGDGENEGEGKNPEEWKWVTTHMTGSFGSKIGALSRGHHLSGERTVVNLWQRYLVDPKGPRAFARSEMDQTWTRPWYQLNVPLNFYWGAVNALNAGQSIWDISRVALQVSKQQGFDYSFFFFNKYAGQIYPATATDAFCALHKGLDAADTKAYPESVFGPAEPGNIARMEKIVAAYAKYGAAIDDKKALTYGQVQQRGDQAGFNDVGWDIWPENYSRLLEQIDADETSIPRWRIGGPITPTSPIYARFARGFEHATGKDALYFKLREGFSADATPKVMSITVVWYDAHAGSTWKLAYDAGIPAMKTALEVTGKGDQQWHHEVVTVRDAVLRHGG
ncbi:MAG: beta-galactosidase, partial [Opitutaceae bacterium]|nr:beta-galactosidase [Opitutaceae bacterium]